ncbi:MAG: hypothetical protein ACLFRP_00995 [Puniceicoccaceae bacterium]
MNRPPRSVLATLAVLALAAAVWYWGFRPTEADRIRERIAELERVVSTPPAAGLMGKAETVAAFRDLLTNPVRIDSRQAPVRGIRSPDEVAAAFLAGSGAGDKVVLDISPKEILFSPDDRATVEIAVSATLTRSGNPPRDYSGNALVEMRKSKEDDSWKFESFEENAPARR